MLFSRLVYTSLVSLLLMGSVLPVNAMNSQELDKNWDYNQPAASEKLFRELSQQLTGAERLEVQTQVARAQGLQGHFDQAHQTLDAIQKSLEGASNVVWVRYLLERGRVLNSSGQTALSEPIFVEALELAQQSHLDFYAVDAAHMLGIVTPAQEQLQWNLKAIVMAESSSDERTQGWLGSLYNNLGWTYHELKDYGQALSLFEKNVAWHQARQTKAGLIIAKWSVARTLRSLKRYQEALNMQTAILAENKALKLEDDGYIYEELGENYWALGQQAAARPFFARAYALLSKDEWFQQNEALRLQRLKTLGAI